VLKERVRAPGPKVSPVVELIGGNKQVRVGAIGETSFPANIVSQDLPILLNLIALLSADMVLSDNIESVTQTIPS
jgi:hypothetical protein